MNDLQILEIIERLYIRLHVERARQSDYSDRFNELAKANTDDVLNSGRSHVDLRLLSLNQNLCEFYSAAAARSEVLIDYLKGLLVTDYGRDQVQKFM